MQRAGGITAGCTLALIAGLSALQPACVPPRPPEAGPPGAPAEAAEHAMVVSDAPEASQVGYDVLRAGGNAVDAAVATAFALAAVYPEAGNIGGGGFMVAHFADGRTAALDFRETAPEQATRTMYLDSTGALTRQSVDGHLASGVPGSVAGLWEAHLTYGRLAWADLLEPAIRLAGEGFILDEHRAEKLRSDSARLARFPASASLYLVDGRIRTAGEPLRNIDLARTLERVAEGGASEFYHGMTADLIVEEMRRGGGLITHRDLAGYKARWRTPLEFTYRAHRILAMPPVSSGGVTLAIIMKILAPYDLASLGATSSGALHLEAEAMRRAFAIRNHYLGDPDAVHMPLDSLLSPEVIERLRSSVTDMATTPSAEVAPAEPAPRERMHTTHLSVVDPWGNAVALTTTLNDLHGSGVTVAGAGFLLNNEMDDFATQPGLPNTFDLVQGEANAIAPGKRMLSSMTPTIVLDERGAPIVVTGARGGPYIISSVFHVISNLLDHRMDLAGAVAAGRIHHQHLPDSLYVERGRFSDSTLQGLERRGHRLKVIGRSGCAPTIVRVDGMWQGVSDVRCGGLARGF